MKSCFLITLFFLLSFIPQNIYPSALVDVNAFIGTWKGFYVCVQGKTGLILEISAETNKIKAIFNFYPLSGTPQAASGSFSLTGEVNADGTFSLKPEHWIEQPPGYGMVGMSGKIKESLINLDGKIDFSGCGNFQLEKEGPSDNTAQVKRDAVNDFNDITLNYRTGEISSFINFDGTISYTSVNTSYQLWFGFLVPHDKTLFPRLTRNPQYSIPFSFLNNSDIDGINFENEFLTNNWRKRHLGYDLRIDFNKILGFENTYNSLKDKNKLSIFKKKDSILEELKSNLSNYNIENTKYTSSRFLLYPINQPNILKESDYNLDNSTLKINLSKNENFYGFNLYTQGSNNALGTRNLKLYGDFYLHVTIDEAIYLFDGRDSLRCYVNIYIKPLNRFISGLFGGLQDFDVNYIVFRFIDNKNNILLDIVLHDFKINNDRSSKNYENYEWSRKIFYYNNLKYTDPHENNNLNLNEMIIGKWKTETGAYYEYFENGTFKYISNSDNITGIWRISDGHLYLTIQGKEKPYNYKILDINNYMYKLSDNERIHTSTKSITSELKDTILGKWSVPSNYTGFAQQGYEFFENGEFSSSWHWRITKGKWEISNNRLHLNFESKTIIYNVDFYDGKALHVSNKEGSLVYLRQP